MRLAVFVGYHYYGLATSVNKNQGALARVGRMSVYRSEEKTLARCNCIRRHY
jgi:hypothetical protein